MAHHSFLDADDVHENAFLISKGATLDSIRTLDEIRVRLRSRACQESTKAMRFHVHFADPKPAPPAPTPEVQEGVSAVLEHFRGGRKRS